VVGADESRRMTGGTATSFASRNRGISSARRVAHARIHHFCKNEYVKPKAFFSVNRSKDTEASQDSLASLFIGRAMVWKSRSN
jgi:hypothetical protein